VKIFVVAAAAGMLTGAVAAYAAGDLTIRQKGKVFSETEISLKKGQELTFLNDDNIAHNVMSTTADNKFNLGLIAPGNATAVTFKTAGDIRVICAIHPTMKMTVKVTD
jgi:plastocyanin